MAQAQESDKGTPQAGTGDPELFADEEIDIPQDEAEPAKDGSAADGTAQDEAEEHVRPEKKRRGPKRYAALTQERDLAKNYAAQLEAELQAERQRSADFSKKAEEASSMTMQIYAANTETKLKNARATHNAALESQDNSKITEASELLASAKAEMDDVEAWKKTEKQKVDAPKPEPRRAQQQQIEDHPADIRPWALENPYWDKYARDNNGNILTDRTGNPLKSSEYDPGMYAEATLYAMKIERQIQTGKLPFKVSSPQYFAAVDRHMKEEFPKYFEDDEEVEEEAPRGSPVAAPTRTVPQSSKNGASQKMTLTGSEVEFVTKMVENGGGPRYPSGHTKQFQPMSLPDAKVSFVRQKLIQAANQ